MERERGSAARKKGGRPGGKAGKRAKKERKSDYFLKPGKQGAVSVLRRPIGNRIEPKLCGTMPTRALAVALVNQLERAESVVKDLFLEATDDGIEALEAILRACRESVERRGARQQQKKHGGGAGATPGQPPQPKHLPRGERGGRHPGGEPVGVAATDPEEEADPYAPPPAPSAGIADATNGAAAAEGRRPRRRQGRRRRSGGRPNGGDGGSDANGSPGVE